VILSALSITHLLKSGEETSSSKAFSVEPLVNVSHSAFENIFLSGVAWNVEGYNPESDSRQGAVLVKPEG
jgi:hypothetical protein